MTKRLVVLYTMGLGLLMSHPALAELQRFRLVPGSADLSVRAFALGMVPIDGSFGRVSGFLALDRADPLACSLELQADATSLQMNQASFNDQATGPDLLDVTRYPDVRIDGRCVRGHLVGDLLLHGVSKPVQFEITIKDGAWIAVGTVRRADWGMTAHPLLAGPEVRITLTAGLPTAFTQ